MKHAATPLHRIDKFTGKGNCPLMTSFVVSYAKIVSPPQWVSEDLRYGFLPGRHPTVPTRVPMANGSRSATKIPFSTTPAINLKLCHQMLPQELGGGFFSHLYISYWSISPSNMFIELEIELYAPFSYNFFPTQVHYRFGTSCENSHFLCPPYFG